MTLNEALARVQDIANNYETEMRGLLDRLTGDIKALQEECEAAEMPKDEQMVVASLLLAKFNGVNAAAEKDYK